MQPEDFGDVSTYLVPFSQIQAWLERQPFGTGPVLQLRYDDVQDLLRHVLAGVPVDEDWYLATYPGVAASIQAGNFQSAQHHYVVHGYFERREPFAPEDPRPRPVPFATLRHGLQVVPRGGRLWVTIGRDALHHLLRQVLIAVPVDADWYCGRFPQVVQEIAAGAFPSAAAEFVAQGYFASRPPAPDTVDAPWYLARYPDVVPEMEAEHGATPDEHFATRGRAQGRFPRPSFHGLLWDRGASEWHRPAFAVQ